MASIKQRKGAKGITYKIDVYKGKDLSGKRLFESTTFVPDPNRTERQNQKALEEFAREFEKKVKGGRTRGESVTFEKFSNEWMSVYAEKELEKTTVASYTTCLKILNPRIGHMKIADIRPIDVQNVLNDIRDRGYKYKNGRQGKYSEETLRTVKTTLSTILSSAVENGYITMNPCTVVHQRNRKQKREESIVNAWTPEQAALFLEKISHPIPVAVPAQTVKRRGKPTEISAYQGRPINVATKYRCFLTLSIYSGCRRGELIALKWENVDFNHGTIRIKESAHYVPGSKQYDGAPKSKSSYREIYIPAEALRLLRQWKREQAEEIMMLGSAWLGDRTQKTGYVFTQETGEVMCISTPNKEFRRFTKAINANLSEADRLPLIHLHDLRHTSASIMIAAGLDPVTVASRLGHSDPTITLKIYSHSFKERDKEAANALEKAIARKMSAS